MARVLVIDDSRLSVSALQNILGNAGHEVVATAFNGEDGVAKAKEANPEVVCLDFVMPDIDGKVTADKLKEINPQIKIVMITQKEIPDGIKSQIQAKHYVIKPITADKINTAFASL